MKLHPVPIILLITLSAGSQEIERHDYTLLARTFPLQELHGLLLPKAAWHPFPTVSRPQELDEIPLTVRQAHIRLAEEQLDDEWNHFPATVFMDFVRDGNRSRFEQLSFGRRKKLADFVLAELFQRQGRFLDQIVNGIWAICEESFWGVPAHLSGQKAGPGLPDVNDPYVDLFAAETGAMMAWIHYLLKPQLDGINPLISERMVHETQRRIMTPYLERYDWGYMGFTWRHRIGYMRAVNNWNPWINANVLTCALLIEDNPEKRAQLVHKCMDSIDNFAAPYPADGGCDEGPSYWGRAAASLYDCLELLYSASDGAIDIFNQPLIQNMGRYIYKTYISDTYYINFADAPAKMNVEPAVVYRFGRAIGDTIMQQFAAHAAKQQNFTQKAVSGSFGCLNRQLPALFTLKQLEATSVRQPFIRDSWFEDIQVMAARSQAGSDRGFYLAAKGGHNDESHNHNDVGNFIIYYDGRPVIIDAGAQTYTRKTFSSRRYELWNNQSAYHNLPTVNGAMQKEGANFRAKKVDNTFDDKKAQFSLDIAAAYPEQAQIDSWQRLLTLHRGKNIVLTETYSLKTFLQPFTLNLLTPLQPFIEACGLIKLSSERDSFMITFDNRFFDPTIETIEINDTRMAGSWGDKVYRIILQSKSDAVIGSYTIIFDRKH